MLATPEEALEILRRDRVLAMTKVPGLRSLVEEVAGVFKGSWWAHPKGKQIFRIASALEDSPEVLGAKLARGKVVFVHSALWPALVRVVLDPGWQKQARQGLAAPARQLLQHVEEAGTLRLEGRAPARHELEKRALVLASSEHTESGKHALTLRSWKDWATPELRQMAAALQLDAALEELRSARLSF
jgi:hypothetical protein